MDPRDCLPSFLGEEDQGAGGEWGRQEGIIRRALCVKLINKDRTLACDPKGERGALQDY